MQKIPTIFRRNPENMRELLLEPHKDCLWVFNGEGLPTQKLDGTCCMIKNGALYKRYELKASKKLPDNFIPAQDPDPATANQPGWVPISDKPEDKYHREAMYTLNDDGIPAGGTYELMGPKIQGNPERKDSHCLWAHLYAPELPEHERTYEGIVAFLKSLDIEGIVYHHPDGRMAKIKKRDFGLRRQPDGSESVG